MKHSMRLLATSLLLLGLSGCVLRHHPQVGASMLDDMVTTDRVEAALKSSNPQAFEAIRVQTSGGVVTLSGLVGSENARQRAAQVAKSVHRATALENDIEVRR
jgi:osmotically-inducible protein OsmY